MTRNPFRTARLLALLVPLALLGGALLSQYIGHLYPCELCWFQRYPHVVAILFAGLAFVLPRRGERVFVALAGLAILASGLIGVFHAGVEYHWWQGLTECTSTMGSGPVTLDSIMKAPVIRCDVAQWRLLGVSLAGFNAIFSIAGALAVFALLRRKRR